MSKFTVRFWRDGATVYMRCLRVSRGVRGHFRFRNLGGPGPHYVESVCRPELFGECVCLSGIKLERDGEVASLVFPDNKEATAWMLRAAKLCRKAGGEVLLGKPKKGGGP